MAIMSKNNIPLVACNFFLIKPFFFNKTVLGVYDISCIFTFRTSPVNTFLFKELTSDGQEKLGKF